MPEGPDHGIDRANPDTGGRMTEHEYHQENLRLLIEIAESVQKLRHKRELAEMRYAQWLKQVAGLIGGTGLAVFIIALGFPNWRMTAGIAVSAVMTGTALGMCRCSERIEKELLG
jgi:hypothetical protein